jgi:hypothetical protein
VRADVFRRWAVVAAGLTVLCAMPVIASALPASVPALTASQLRARILASSGQSYAGYAESNATFGLPSLPGLNGVASLLDGVTKMRVWVASPDDWRVDVLSDAGERDTYQLGAVSYIWDSGQELLTEVGGQPSLRLPRPADLVPPALAVRLLAAAGAQARFGLIPPLRVAGQSVAGLRVTPADASSTIGHVDIWAEPGSGLPLMVEIFGRGSVTPALESQFFQVGRWRPDRGVLTPQRGPGTGFTMTSARSLAGALSHLALEVLPAELAGRDEVPGPPGFGTVSIYGGGLATFVVVAVRSSQDLIGDALSAGGAALRMPGARGALIGAPLVNAVLVQPSGFALTFLIVGTVSPGVLEQAAATLVADRVWLP